MREVVFTEDSLTGISKKEIFIKISNNFVREIDGKIQFTNSSEHQLDYLVYMTLISKMTILDDFNVTLNTLIETMGFKPRTGKGSITERVKSSLDRLQLEHRLIRYEYKNAKEIQGSFVPLDPDKKFFKIKLINLMHLLSNNIFKMNENDNLDKYTDKAKTIYVYSYLLSLMGNHKTTEAIIHWRGCFPSLEQICRDCNVSKEFLLKQLAYFEYDGLIFTTNIGYVSKDKSKMNACNYYTDDMRYLSSSYIYARAYYDMNGYKHSKYYYCVKDILSEIKELLEKSSNRLNKKELSRFKPFYRLIIENTLRMSEKYFIDISYEKSQQYIESQEFLKTKFEGFNGLPVLLFVADNRDAAVPLLYHLKNKLKALMYLYDIR